MEDCQKRTAIYIASYKGYYDACEILTSYTLDINSMDIDGTTPLLAAIWGSHRPVMEILIEKKADVNRIEIFQGSSPLHIAVQMRNFDITAILANVSILKKKKNFYKYINITILY